jgi:lipid II:glycine glycyltransferase (peptidoglycan interpeptide bridge formation enzyme)
MGKRAEYQAIDRRNSRISFQITYEIHDQAWDKLLGAIPESHFEQTSLWGAVKASYGWQVLRILAILNTKLIGGVQVLVRRFGPLAKIGYIARGPMVLPGYNEVERMLVAEVDRIAKRDFWLYCVFDYPYNVVDHLKTHFMLCTT